MDLPTFIAKLSVTEAMLLVTAIYTIINFALTFWINRSNYKHLRHKDFQELLYNSKIDIYKNLISLCQQAYISLDIGVKPLNKINTISKEDWNTYYLKIIKLSATPYEIKVIINKEILLLPSTITNLTLDYTIYCETYITMAYHRDDQDLTDRHEILFQKLNRLIEAYRTDLGVDFIDKRLATRLGNRTITKRFEKVWRLIVTKLQSSFPAKKGLPPLQ
jgi:hypothetical protein